MSSKRRDAAVIRFSLALLSLPVFLVACDDPLLGPNSGDNARRPMLSALPGDLVTLDDEFGAIAEKAPSFAGLYVDEMGSLVVLTTEESQIDQVVLAIRASSLAHVEKNRSGGTRPRRYTKANYGFLELRRYKDLINSGTWAHGLVMLDIDEVANKIRIVVPTLDAANRVRLNLTSRGVPLDAFDVQLGSVGIPEAVVSDKFRPVPGGVQVADSAGQGPCTSGVNVDALDFGVGFITASHCTYRFGDASDGTPFYQNTLTAGNRIGLETADGDTFSCIKGGTTYDCRYADAAFISYDSTQHSQHGTIARTLGPGGAFATVINSNSPRFLLSMPPFQAPVTGDTVHKVGKTTGWTKGAIVATCFDQLWRIKSQGSFKNFYLLCQYAASYASDHGDSGSPVFEWSGSGSYVDLLGIHAGKYAADTSKRIFSRWLYVDLELNSYTGSLSVEY